MPWYVLKKNLLLLKNTLEDCQGTELNITFYKNDIKQLPRSTYIARNTSYSNIAIVRGLRNAIAQRYTQYNYWKWHVPERYRTQHKVLLKLYKTLAIFNMHYRYHLSYLPIMCHLRYAITQWYTQYTYWKWHVLDAVNCWHSVG